jgi:hypothetical protein
VEFASTDFTTKAQRHEDKDSASTSTASRSIEPPGFSPTGLTLLLIDSFHSAEGADVVVSGANGSDFAFLFSMIMHVCKNELVKTGKDKP